MARQRSSRYSRSARLGELLREIIATELSRIDDDRLELASITGVETDTELSRATVYISVLDDNQLSAALEAFEEHRLQLKRVVARSGGMRRVPELVFTPDPAIFAGEQVDRILRDLDLE